MTIQRHLPTKAAAEALGIADSTIRKWSSSPGAIFLEGEHWHRRGTAPQSPRVYDIFNCASAMERQGYYVPPITKEALQTDPKTER